MTDEYRTNRWHLTQDSQLPEPYKTRGSYRLSYQVEKFNERNGKVNHSSSSRPSANSSVTFKSTEATKVPRSVLSQAKRRLHTGGTPLSAKHPICRRKSGPPKPTRNVGSKNDDRRLNLDRTTRPPTTSPSGLGSGRCIGMSGQKLALAFIFNSCRAKSRCRMRLDDKRN